MREWTETRREGTDMGPIDWSHPMVAKVRSPEVLAMLREAEANPQDFIVTSDGGWPRVGWGDVLAVRMYDGWPYWQPMPAVLKKGTLGPEWNFFDTLDIRRKRPCPSCKEGTPVPHNGSRYCESGSIASGGNKAHCTCDVCF